MAGASATVTHPRATAVVRRIAELGAEPGRREAVALGLVDGVRDGDAETLAAALDALRDARARAEGDQELVGWLDAAIAFAHWGLERAPSPAAVAPGTQAHAVLRALAGAAQVGSAELRRLLGVDETQVSRTGRRLLERGLVTRRKVGREVFWQITPRGRRALEDAPGPAPGADDRTRERIVRSALELHTSRGIQATTFADVAARAGVPLEIVEALFPTQEELVKSCAAHFMERLQLPPADRAPEVFAGASTARERSRRLVETVFGVYERGADGIAAGRRERHAVPVADESMQALDTTLDALVAEALGPRGADRSAVEAVRARTDLEVWRALRDEGATPDEAVEQAAADVERWLSTR